MSRVWLGIYVQIGTAIVYIEEPVHRVILYYILVTVSVILLRFYDKNYKGK